MQVLIGIALGVALALVDPALAESMKPLGDLFIKLIKMMIPPIIFCTVVTGIVHMGDMRKAGRLGLKALIYFEVLTTLAMILGLIAANVTKSGSGMGIDPAALDAEAVAMYTQEAAKEHTTMGFILDLVPHSFIGALADGNLLQTLLIALFFAWAMMGMGSHGAPLLRAIEGVSHVFFRMVGIVMRLAPIGAFGAMAFTVGKYGVATLGELMGFVGLFYATCLIFVIFVLGVLLKVTTGLSIFRLMHYIRSELLIVLGTSSSETVLPRILDKMERLGCERQVVGMVVPTGYSFNLDGSSMYFPMAILFLAHALGIELSFSEQMSAILVLLLTSKGAAGVYGSAFIVLAGTLSSMTILPVAAVSILLGIDRFMSIGRALTNLVGNCVATVIMARWEKALDISRARGVLDGSIHPHGDTDVSEIVLSTDEAHPTNDGR